MNFAVSVSTILTMLIKTNSKTLLLILIFLAISTDAQKQDFYECVPGIKSPGVLLPRGDFDVEIGSPEFPLYCHLNPESDFYKKKGLNSSNLRIHQKNQTSGKPNEYQIGALPVVVLNETTIKAMYNPHIMSKDVIECRIEVDGIETAVCNSHIHVGFPPLKPENFTCISENWQNLNCTWDIPYNPVPTEYKLFYWEPGRRGRNRFYECPDTKNNNECYLPLDEDTVHNQHYRRTWPKYHFAFEMKNILRKNSTFEPFIIDNFASVRPNPPREVKLTATSPTCIDLWYTVDNFLHFFPPGLKQEVRYRSQYDPINQWTLIPEISFMDTNKDIYDANFTKCNLTAYTTYYFKVRMLSQAANASDESMWSSWIQEEIKTKSKIPQNPPQIAQGSFEVVSRFLEERTIYVYWRHLMPEAHNGPNLQYEITKVIEDGKIRPLDPEKITKSYALFEHMHFTNYTFFITSKNDKGTANSTSQVFVPSYEKVRNLQPKSFTKIAYNETLFEVSWFPPNDESNVQNYTIFWCLSENNRDRPYQCEGQLDWIEVSSSTRSYNVTLPSENVYQFAVAANTEKYSSGMVWATCTILHNKVVGKLKTVTVDVVKKESMLLRWRLDCSDRVGIVTGYAVSYCPIGSPDPSSECIGEKSVWNTTGEEVTITGLQPWTYYKVGVAAVTKAGVGELSDFLVNRTKSARPGSPPNNFHLAPIQNIANSVTLKWEKPVKPNGIITHYNIEYAYRDHQNRNVAKQIKTKSDFYVLKDLAFNAKYDIKVQACSMPEFDIQCGNWAAKIYRTGIGKSGQMPAPVVTFINSTEVEVKWDPSSFHHGGPIIDSYELIINSTKTEEKFIQTIQGNLTRIKLSLTEISENLAPDCTNASMTNNLYNFTIRAVTIDKKFQKYFGDWSHVEVVPAYCGASLPWAMIISICVILPIIAFVVMIYVCRFYKSCHEEVGMFKDVDKEAEDRYKQQTSVPATNAIVMNGIHHSPNKGSPKQDWTEMQDMPSPQSGKKAAYQRAGSKDSMENLLNKERAAKTVTDRGTSESTSGCESGQEIDESDELDNLSAKSSSQTGCGNEPSSEEDSGHVRSSPSNYVMQISMGLPPDAQLVQSPPEGANIHPGRQLPASATNSPYSIAGLNGWHPMQNNNNAGATEGYTRAIQNLDDLRPPPLPFSTHQRSAAVRQNEPYVTFNRTNSHGSSPISNTSNSPSISSGSTTPVVMSSPTASGFPPEVASGFPPEVLNTGAGYITVDEAMKKVIRASDIIEPPQNLNNINVSDPRAYSRVTNFVTTNSGFAEPEMSGFSPPEVVTPPPKTPNPPPSTLVVSAIDLQVDSRSSPAFRKVVTSSVDGCNPMSKSTGAGSSIRFSTGSMV